ncbi:MAG: M23 family metallopeptidase [candidate division WOR-3 bacterium]
MTRGFPMEIIVVNERKNKTFNFLINWSIVSLIILFIIAIMVLFIYGIVNFARSRVDYKRLHLLTKENAIIQKDIEHMESEIKSLNIMLDSLAKRDTVLKYFSGLMPIEKFINELMIEKVTEERKTGKNLSETLDKLLIRVEQNYSDNKAIVDYLNKKERLKDLIPSIPPVNGWFMRGFGYAHDPFTGTMRMHEGIDIAAPVGTPIIATADGVVRKINNKRDFGVVIEISHSEGFETIYAHCQNPAVRQGQSIKRGDIIAYVGTSGKTTGPHLHYEIRIDGVPVNPIDYIMISKGIVADE